MTAPDALLDLGPPHAVRADEEALRDSLAAYDDAKRVSSAVTRGRPREPSR